MSSRGAAPSSYIGVFVSLLQAVLALGTIALVVSEVELAWEHNFRPDVFACREGGVSPACAAVQVPVFPFVDGLPALTSRRIASSVLCLLTMWSVVAYNRLLVKVAIARGFLPSSSSTAFEASRQVRCCPPPPTHCTTPMPYFV